MKSYGAGAMDTSQVALQRRVLRNPTIGVLHPHQALRNLMTKRRIPMIIPMKSIPMIIPMKSMIRIAPPKELLLIVPA